MYTLGRLSMRYHHLGTRAGGGVWYLGINREARSSAGANLCVQPTRTSVNKPRDRRS